MTHPLIEEYLSRAPDLQALLHEQPSFYWTQRGEKQILDIFRQMSIRVPAYQDFLQKNGVSPHSIQTIEDFRALPVTNKENYLQSYPLKDLCWDGHFKEGHWIISSTSGSTGEPFYFPRTKFKDQEFTLTAELALREYFEIHKKSTLFIDCFALGVWIGGMFMYQVIKNLVDRGDYQLTIITPGADKVEAIKAVKNLAPHFEQVILGGYGPLVKDLIDDGINQGIDWNQYHMKYFFAAEGFTEGYRDYLVKKGGVQNPYTDTINHYGTADLGTMAHETPLSILIRRLATQNSDLYNDIFANGNKLPTLTQFMPELFYFERITERLACSGLGGLPLMRYDLKDRGDVHSFENTIAICSRHGIDVVKEAGDNGIEHTIWKLPFVYVAERADFTVSIYSVNIYPESIRKALEAPELENSVSGKFTMLVDFNEEQNQFLQINVELRPGVAETKELKKKTLDSVIAWLSKENSEWRDFYADEGIRHKVTPELVFWPYQHETYFKPGRKQKWVKKQK